ncbi:hypothetical protein ACX80N_16760 [Arthrobacter sp. MDT2-16]
MHATLNRVSLVTEIDTPHVPPDLRYFHNPANFDSALSRVLFHEATHYWQQLSSLWLLLMATEDWVRLHYYHETGKLDGPTTIRSEYKRHDPSLGFSIHDLIECTSRYWDVQSVGPHNLIEAELARGRILSPDLQSEYEATIANGMFRAPNDDYSSATVSLAMRIVGGSYARPYTLLEKRLGDFTIFLFPLLSHWALQTRHPLLMFQHFEKQAAEEIRFIYQLRKLRRLWRRDESIQVLDMQEHQKSLYLMLHPAIAKRAKAVGNPLRPAVDTFPHLTYIHEHPIYAWSFSWLKELGRVAEAEGKESDVNRYYHKRNEARAWAISDRMLALPGGNRSLLYHFVQPPVYRFKDDKTWFTGVEPADEDNLRVASMCIEIHNDWEAFRQASRGY